MKTAELTGATLDWAVAKSKSEGEILPAWFMGEDYALNYSTNWARGGPIIERESMHIDCLRRADYYRCAVWEAWPYATGTKHIQQGPTPLIAAMRCYVASKLGDDVEVPNELTGGK